MEKIPVRELMVPLSEYVRVKEDATLLDAIHALEEARVRFRKEDEHHHHHRAILVEDEQGRLVGKISYWVVLRALEPRYNDLEGSHSSQMVGFPPEFLSSLMEEYALWKRPIQELCCEAARRRVSDIMYTPAEGEFVEEDCSMDEAIHKMVLDHHQSLLVTETRSRKVVGVLRLTDVFLKVADLIKGCGSR